RKSNQLAHHLRALGVGAEVRVGICMERSPEMVIGLLGVLKAGGAYVPLDPTYPEQRLTFMLADAQVPVLLTLRHQDKIVNQSKLKVVCFDKDWEVIERESDQNPSTRGTADNLAYVIYTSGSTGQPKGVMVEHRSVLNLAVALNKTAYAHQNSPLRVS